MSRIIISIGRKQTGFKLLHFHNHQNDPKFAEYNYMVASYKNLNLWENF